MLHQWSILLHELRRGRLSVLRRKDDLDPAAAGGGSPTPVDPAAPAADPTPAADPVDAPHPDPLAPVSDDDAMWGDLKPDDPAPVDPNALPAVPAEFSKALSISEYVKEPAHVEAAVQTASEVWDVVSGKKTAASLLEAMRAQNPTQYDKTVLEDLVPYIERITGKKFGDPSPDDVNRPMTVAEYHQRQADDQRKADEARQTQQQQQEYQRNVQTAEQVGGKKVEELIAAGNGIFDGDVNGAIQAVAAQYVKLGLDPAVVMKEVLSGNTANVEKAYKAAEKAETLRVKSRSDAIRAKFKTLKAAVPASRGSGGTPTPIADGAPDLTTAQGRAKWMTEQFKAGAGAE